MEQWIKTKGKLVYDPFRRDFRKTFKARTLIVQLPKDELDLYYQWFLKKQYGSWMEVQRPMFGRHVTVVRGNEPLASMERWKMHAGEEVEFFYSPRLMQVWQFWVLPVTGKRLLDLRAELGLGDHNFHLTIGRMYDWQH